jgi:hypothetical protein
LRRVIQMSNWNTLNPFPNGVAKVIAGSNVSVSGTTAYPIITNTGVASLTAGSNITLSGSTGNITIAASGGGSSGGTPVYIENFTGSSSNFFPSENTTYFYYTNPVAFPTYPNVPVYTSFYLPRASSLSNGNWIQIVPLHSTSTSNGTGIYLYHSSNYIVLPSSSTDTAQSLLLVVRSSTWNYSWNGSNYVLDEILT